MSGVGAVRMRVIAALVLVVAAIAANAPRADAAEHATTRVSYLAGGSVYLEAGREIEATPVGFICHRHLRAGAVHSLLFARVRG